MAVAGILTATSLMSLGTVPVVWSATARLPPVDASDPNRCILSSSAIGQANAARDKLLDARLCDLHEKDYRGYDISGVLLEGARADGSRFDGAQLSKAYAPRFSCRNCSFVDAVVDRANFDGADLTGSVFTNTVLSDSLFTDSTVLKDVDFTDAYAGEFVLRRICSNPTFQGENPSTGVDTRASLGCRDAR